jgi:hypothetical protein
MKLKETWEGGLSILICTSLELGSFETLGILCLLRFAFISAIFKRKTVYILIA